MHIVRSRFVPKSGKVYDTVLLRESYREGKKVKKRTVGNLTNCSAEEIAAIELALKHKGNLGLLTQETKPNITEGLSVGSVWTVFQMAKRLGIVSALGNSRQGQLALWQVIARVLEQGSRLSAVRLAETYAIAPVIGLESGFNEDDLYQNLSWLCKNQQVIEDKLFRNKKSHKPANLFLYDVTSSYLEGDKNELASWGYNRDKKKGKKQIVIGLLSSDDGTPVSTEVFRGNTQDTATFASQVEKAKERFKCDQVTFVGDRGMIKSGQIEGLQEYGFHYITAISKCQIETLIKANTIQYTLFDKTLVEVKENGVRYILRRNPVRAKEIETARVNKRLSIEQLVGEQNKYLNEHPRAHVDVAIRKVRAKIDRLSLNKWIQVYGQKRVLKIEINDAGLEEESRLDGCYVIKTDLSDKNLNKEEVHQRYKDLAMVESAFRSVKSDLDVRPIYVRSEMNTRGHVLIVMLSYMILRELNELWKDLYLTAEEGLRSLSTITLLDVSFGGKKTFQEIPEPRIQNKKMLEALDIKLPKILPRNEAHVVTRKNRRKQA